MLTAVAGRSSVAAAGAVTVEGAPRLTAPPAVFTVTWRAPERKTETDNGRVCQERKTYLGKFLKEKPQASSAPDCTGEQVSVRKPRLRARLRTKGKLPFLKRKISQGAFPCQVGRRRLLSKVNPFCKSRVRHRRSSWIATQPVAPKKKKQSLISSFMFMYVVPAIFKIQGHASLLNLPSAETHQKLGTFSSPNSLSTIIFSVPTQNTMKTIRSQVSLGLLCWTFISLVLFT